jgi:hypothetical protein
MEKVNIERKHIGNSFLPRKGVFAISEVRAEFPSAPFVEVRDMDGVKFTVHRNSVSIFKPTSNESENPTV